MKIVFISEHGNSLPVAWKLMQQGVECFVYVHEPAYRKCYAGLIPRISLHRLEQRIKEASHIVIDMVRSNCDSPEDKAFLKQFSLSKTDGVFGALGDKIRKTHPDKVVIGGGVFSEEVELNREKGIALARKLGFDIPEYHKFVSLSAGVKFLAGPGKDREWFLKPNGNIALDLTCGDTYKGEILDLLANVLPERLGTDKTDFVLQAKVDNAVELSSALWFYKGQIVSANRTFESKKFIEGDKGPNMGSASNTVWQCKTPDGIVHKQMQGLTSHIGGLCGEVDANCMIDKEGKAWFLEWTFMRYGLDALYNQQAMIAPQNRPDFWFNGFKAKYQPGFSASQRLTLWPAPRVHDEEDRKMVRGNLVNHSIDSLQNWWLQDVMLDGQDKLRVVGADGLIGVVTCVARDMEDAINACQKECKDFQVTGDKQWRTDHLDKHMERRLKLRRWGIKVF